MCFGILLSVGSWLENYYDLSVIKADHHPAKRPTSAFTGDNSSIVSRATVLSGERLVSPLRTAAPTLLIDLGY